MKRHLNAFKRQKLPLNKLNYGLIIITM